MNKIDEMRSIKVVRTCKDGFRVTIDDKLLTYKNEEEIAEMIIKAIERTLRNE